MPLIAVLLAVAFIVLKIVGIIAWSWLWVLSPLWIGLVLTFGFFALWAVIASSFSRR